MSPRRARGQLKGVRGNPTMAAFLRKLVSQNKHRHQADGYDLDLTYLTDQIICMGLPAAGPESLYRNPIEQVVSFLEKNHAGNYKVFNLCNERSYDISLFGDACCSFPFDDHSAPPLALIIALCHSAKAWLRGGMERVVVIHCKAGKGRTGCMACSLLLHLGFERTAAAAMLLYDTRRTHDGKGLTSPSQRRFVGYYERVLAGEPHEGVERTIDGLKLLNGPAKRPIIIATIHRYGAATPGEPLRATLAAGRGAPSGALREARCVGQTTTVSSDLRIELTDGESGALIARVWVHPALEPSEAWYEYRRDKTKSQIDLPAGLRRGELKLETGLPEGFTLVIRFGELRRAAAGSHPMPPLPPLAQTSTRGAAQAPEPTIRSAAIMSSPGTMAGPATAAESPANVVGHSSHQYSTPQERVTAMPNMTSDPTPRPSAQKVQEEEVTRSRGYPGMDPQHGHGHGQARPPMDIS